MKRLHDRWNSLFAAALTCVVAAPAAAAEVASAVLDAQTQRIAVMDKAKDAVVAVFAPRGDNGGSGVVISPDGYALTNFHVVAPCGKSMKCGLADGRIYDAVIVGIDPVGDVALIRLFGRNDFPAATMGDSDLVQMGDNVFAMGNPFLLAADFQPTVTCGILSGVHRYQYPSGTLLEYADCLQTDASINPGNSGGPLFDASGKLIGINGRCSFQKRGRVNVGVGYAISINQIKNFLGFLHAGRIVDHATLGATVAFDEDRRVVVNDVLETADAYRRGLRYGDEVLSLGRRPIHTPNGLKNILGTFPKGWRAPMKYSHQGKTQEVLVRLTGVHSENELFDKLTKKPMAPELRKPGEKKGPKQPGQKPDKEKEPDEEIPMPVPSEDEGGAPHGQAKKPPLPEIVKKHFEEKRGFANYYFNRLHRDRIWKAWVAKGDFAPLNKSWMLEGPLMHGGNFRLDMNDGGISMKLPRSETQWKGSDELGADLSPDGSGGLFAALHLWRRLAVLGPDKFGQVEYLGAVPLAGRADLVDALLGVYGGVQCRFYFDTAEGTLLAMEMAPSDEVDPCEIYFSEYREHEGRLLPRRIEVRWGNDPFAVFTCETYQFEKASP